MHSQRIFVSLHMRLMKLTLALLSLCLSLVACSRQQAPTDFVNPMVGTDFNGHTFPGATLPFGMVQLSPDTRIDGSWEGCSGYHYTDNRIYGFSHTHLSGTGVSDYGDILLMPQTGTPSFHPDEYSATFNHQNEHASAGYYEVTFDNEIKAQLTASERVGFHKYSFPSEQFSVILDLTHRDNLVEKGIQVLDNNTLAVKRVSSAWARNQHCYAHMEFSESFTTNFNSDSSKVLLSFETQDKELLVKVGISFTDELGARKNLKNEIDHWDFDQARIEALAAWNVALSKIEVTDTDEEKLRTFYTALYHTMIHPNVAMDVDSRYRGMDNQIHKANGFTYYTVFSLWDTFRATHPLFTLIERKRTRDFIRTFLAMYEQGGRLPVWELCSNETDCMIGYHSVSVMADALSKGIDDFDVDLAYEAMTKSANWDHLGLPDYTSQGFLSVDDEHESVSKTLEYAYDDWCIAQVAARLDNQNDYRHYMDRSNAWRNLLDPETSLMRPRKNGGWLTPFEPREVNNHFTEGNSWQYSFFVPQDVSGMIEAMGGNQAFESKLDALFTAPVETTGRTQADITGLIGQYAHGNEPSHHMAYLYNYVGKPAKTKQRVHQILDEFYTSKPDGLIGNEDCGQMSAWYVMSALGIYAVTPGQYEYALVEPFLDDYTVHLESGQSFSKNTVTSALKNALFIRHDELTGSKTSSLQIDATPDLQYVQAPVFRANAVSFDDSMLVSFDVPEGSFVRYHIQYEEMPAVESSISPVTLTQSAYISAYTVDTTNGQEILSKPTHARYYKNPHPTWDVDLKSVYNPQYSAGGPKGLIDGIRGDEHWRKGYWQGFQDQDFEVIIDMKQSQSIRQITSSFLQDTRSWIVYPTQVDYFASENGVDFKHLSTLETEVAADNYDHQTDKYSFVAKNPIKARYLKVTAKNYGTLPDWHQGAGGEAFIFIDEIEIE